MLKLLQTIIKEIKRLEESLYTYLVVKNNLDYAISESVKLGLTLQIMD